MDTLTAQIPQQVVNGLSLGAVYALIALGYSMVYGVLRLLNLAHGDVYMVGAFVGYGVLSLLAPGATPLVPAWAILPAMLLAAMLVCGLLGVAIERLAYRPLRRAPRLAALLSALGVSFFLQNAMLLVASGRVRTLASELLIPTSLAVELGDLRVSVVRLLVLLTAIILMVGLHLLVRRTRLGRSMRAVAVDREAAAMTGVDVDRVVVSTFFLGSALAGVAGVLVALLFTQVSHVMGFAAGFKGLTAAVLGGVGSMPGAMLGGLLLGLTGGPNGITGVDPLATVGARPPDIAESYLIWLIALGLVVLAISHLDRSPLGRAWRAIGEDPLAAASLGIPVNRVRLLALAVAGGMAGLGGAIFAAWQRAVFPSSFDLGLLITLYGMLVLGGVGSLRGAVVGAVLLTLLPELLRDPATASLLFYGCGAGLGLLLRRRWRALAVLIPAFVLATVLWETRLAAEPSVTRLLFLGALLVVLMIYRPHGLFGRPRVEVL
jgi:branched-chain amino acid transport system permease protein